MKKTLPLFILSIGTLLTFPSFAARGTNGTITNSPSHLQINTCGRYTSNIESTKICINDSSFRLERLSACVLYSSSFVGEAICLKNKALTTEQIVECSFTNTHLEEQVCLLNTEKVMKTVESVKTIIEQLIKFKVEFDPTTFLFLFPKNIENDTSHPPIREKQRESGIEV